MEINPQSVILPDAPLSNHTIRVDIQWTPANLPGWILYYDLDCDQNNHSSTTSTTGTNTYSLTSPGYENYQIQFRFGSLDPNQPTITGTYQLYFDEQLIRSASFQAQPASYSNFAYFNTHYQSPVLTDYTFSIYTSEICPGRYEDIYLTTSRNCNATAEINTEQDSITLTIETGKEFVSFYKNNQKKDTVTFMYHELGSVYLRQDSIYTGTASINVNIKSDWTGIIKYQQLVINPQEQFQIRVPDQPIIVFSGGVGGLKIEPYSSSICSPYISENLKYTALIKKGSSRGLLYDYDTGQNGDTLTNLTPQEDGEKYLDFITEGEILNEEDTVLIKIFANDENIDTAEAIIIIYPNNIDVQIIPPVISQGDTARVVLKKRGENGLEDFPIDQLFDVEITQGIDYGLILDSLSNDTLSSFTDIPQGFKIIAKDSTGIDSTKIRIKVTTEDSGFPEEKMKKNNTKQNKKEIVDDNKNQKNDDEIITPDWIIPGPILLEGFGDVVVKQDGCDEEIVVCENLEPQPFDKNWVKVLKSNQDWDWIDQNGVPIISNTGDFCLDNKRSGCDMIRFGYTKLMSLIGKFSSNPSNLYVIFNDVKIDVCLDNRDPNNPKWLPSLSNLRIPIFSDFCNEQPQRCGWNIDLLDGSNVDTLAKYIKSKNDYNEIMDALDWWWTGSYQNDANGNYYWKLNIPKYYFSSGIIRHEKEHVNIHTDSLKNYMESSEGFTVLKTDNDYLLNTKDFNCPSEAAKGLYWKIKSFLDSKISEGYNRGRKTDLNGNDITEYECDKSARSTYDSIKVNINTWAKSNGIIP